MPRSWIALTVCACLALTAPAFADGPYEPNETSTEAFGPLAGGAMTAAFETPQDVDWFTFYALNHRQIGVLLTLSGTCPVTSGAITVALLDGEVPSYSANLGTATVGYSYSAPPATAGQVSFTSLAGHRYLMRVTQRGCMNTAYTLEVAPSANLTQTLVDTAECAAAKSATRREFIRLSRLRGAFQHSHGARRRDLRSKVAIQRQTTTVALSTSQTACTRPTLTGYPFT
jgi:hypothetical protein